MPTINLNAGQLTAILAVVVALSVVAFKFLDWQIKLIQSKKNSNGYSKVVIPSELMEIFQNSTVAIQNNNKAIESSVLVLTAMQGTLGKLCDTTTRQSAQIDELLAHARKGGG